MLILACTDLQLLKVSRY